MPRTKNKQKKFHVKRGDTVKIITGVDVGKSGKILEVIPSKERVIVEGVNVKVKHQKPSQEYPQGGRVEREMPIHISNVMPIDPISGNPTRIGRKQLNEDGRTRWVRYSKDSGEVLDK